MLQLVPEQQQALPLVAAVVQAQLQVVVAVQPELRAGSAAGGFSAADAAAGACGSALGRLIQAWPAKRIHAHVRAFGGNDGCLSAPADRRVDLDGDFVGL